MHVCVCERETTSKIMHITHQQSKWSRKATRGLGTVRRTRQKGGTYFALVLSSLEQGAGIDVCYAKGQEGSDQRSCLWGGTEPHSGTAHVAADSPPHRFMGQRSPPHPSCRVLAPTTQLLSLLVWLPLSPSNSFSSQATF